jgi:hypothetical protein
MNYVSERIGNKSIVAYRRVYPKGSGLSHNGINNRHALGSNTKGYGSKTH